MGELELCAQCGENEELMVCADCERETCDGCWQVLACCASEEVENVG